MIMAAKNKWLNGMGVLIGMKVLFFMPIFWHTVYLVSHYGYGMWGGMHMRGGMGYGFSPMFGGMGSGIFLMWLVPLGLLVLIGLGIAALIKYLKTPPTQ